MFHDDFQNMKKLKTRTFLRDLSANLLVSRGVSWVDKANRPKCSFNISSYTYIYYITNLQQVGNKFVYAP